MLPGVLAMGLSAALGLSEPTPTRDAPILFIDAAREAGGGIAKRPDPIVIGSVTTRVSPTHIRDPIPLLRKYLQTELEGIDWSKRRVKGPYTLFVSLVRLETSQSKRAVVSSCVVTASVQDAKHGLVVSIDGKANAEDAASAGARAENDALAAAVHSSMVYIPDAIAPAQ